ncbi:MAG TPA: NADH-quinone oxidoreductase subunit M [Myxococcales bacterium]|nr:NADH-quinone oxidoreductase subunit M [Myxococcales bacterium]
MNNSTILTWMTFVPLIGAALMLPVLLARAAGTISKEMGDQISRVIALVASGIVLVQGFILWRMYDPANPGLQFAQQYKWIPAYNIEYFVGVDGISITLVMLTALISFIATIASMPWWPGNAHLDDHHFTQHGVPGYMAMLLILQTGMTGVFVSMDMFLFYVFWEVMLLPMYFLIGIWGGSRKEYAAIKFFLYTLAGSVLMLLAIIGLYFNGPTEIVNGAQVHTFNMIKMTQWAHANGYASAPLVLGMSFMRVAWVALFIGFAVKIPMFPFHTWLPDAHVEAPTPISVILAGVLLKMGIYGILRINYAILPQATKWAAQAMAVFGAINIVYAAFVCLAQKDLKRMIAYSSVSHMGFCLLGMSAFTKQGIDGAVLNLWTHGLISPMLFLIVGVIYDRAHHRNIEGFGGLAKQVPEYAGLLGLAFFASLGLPGLCGFWAEFTVLMGSLSIWQTLTIISALSVIITAAYYLWAIQRMMLGPLNEKYATLADVNWRERLTLYPLGALIIVFGFYPKAIFDLINLSLHNLIAPLQ